MSVFVTRVANSVAVLVVLLESNLKVVVKISCVVCGSTITGVMDATVNYSDGSISIDGIYITTISDVDGASSTLIRITAIPDSLDIVPVRNQILEIDFTNSTVTGEVDTVATGEASAGTDYSPTSTYQTTKSF